MSSEELNTPEISEEIRNLRAETLNLRRPFYRKIEFWAVIAPVLTLVGMTIWQNYFSRVSDLKEQTFLANKAEQELELEKLNIQEILLEIDIKNFEEKKFALNEGNKKLELKNSELIVEIENSVLTKRMLSEVNENLETQNGELSEHNVHLTELNRNLRQDIQSAEWALEDAEDRLVCREIYLAIRDTKNLAYSLAATVQKFNFGALSSIGEREGYLSPDEAETVDGLSYGFWYADWKEGTEWVGDDLFSRSLGAQLVALIVVGAIDIGSLFSPFSNDTDADMDWPLSRLLTLAIEQAESADAKEFLTEQMDDIKSVEEPGISSLLPHVSFNAMNEVTKLTSVDVPIKEEHLMEFTTEVLRLKEAHSEASYVFKTQVMVEYEVKCSKS